MSPFFNATDKGNRYESITTVATIIMKQILKIKKRPSPTLTYDRRSLARGLRCMMNPICRKMRALKMHYIKGTSARTSNLPGSMTVEAALIVPLFLFFFLNLCSILEMVRLHGNIQMALWETGRQTAVYSYLYGELDGEEERRQTILKLGGTLLTDFVLQSSIVHYLGEDYLDSSPLVYGSRGLSLLESSFPDQGDVVDIKVTYEVAPWLKIGGFPITRMSNRYYGRAWTGYELTNDSQETELVYVTAHGTVYHVTLDCSYLKRTIQEKKLWEIPQCRNAAGGNYYLCELCGRISNNSEVVYITMNGNRYHVTKDCQALKRTVQSMPRKEAMERYAPCGRCAAAGNG